ncbi:MAG TPA: ABC transporter permease [Bryobacteraceae bacterium]|nr:ABC transporter permease [Bryobacteraceae bacterium]
MSLASRIRALVGRRTEAELDDELQFHLAQQVDEYLAAGMPRAEAERAARRALGGIAQLKEECRDARGVNWLMDLARDVRYALRTLGRSPGFALAAILTLALGIGANTAVFSIADAVLLKMLPVRDPQRLVRIQQPSVLGNDYYDFSFVNYREMQTAAAPFLDLAAEGFPNTVQAVMDGARERVGRAAVSGNYFAVLGVEPAIGRTFQPSIDNEIGRHPEAVISYGYWQRRFNRDPAAIGRWIRFGDTPFQIIGVAQPGFSGLVVGAMTDVWTPIVMGPARQLQFRGMTVLRVVGRLKPGATAAQALAPLQVWYHRMEIEWMRAAPAGTRTSLLERAAKLQLKIEPAARGISRLREQYGQPIEIVFAVVALVLLLACGNVAHLLLARAGARQREMAVRISVGAGRGRLIRQLLTESLLLGVAAAALGMLAARWTAPALVAMLAPSDAPVRLDVGLDARVLAFTLLVSIATAVAFGILPSLRASKVDIHSALKSGVRLAGRGPAWQARWLVGMQMALSLVLLVGSGLFVRTLINLKTLDPGFDQHNVMLAGVHTDSPVPADDLARAWFELLRRAVTIPGVESASVAIGGPFVGASMNGPVRVQGATSPANLEVNWFIPISPNFFRTLGGRLVAGRDFEPRDFEPAAPRVTIVSETMARRYFGSENPLGRRIENFEADPPHWIEIVGVAADMKFDSLRTAAPAMVYQPFTQFGGGAPQRIMTLVLRARRDTLSLAPALRREVAASGGGLMLNDILTQTRMIDDTLIRERLLATVGSFFGFVALLLAALGLYGTVGYAVSRRTQEIGIRMALGARQGQVVSMILREALAPVALGGLAGAGAAIWAGRLVAGLLFGIRPQDPGAILLAAAMLAGTSIAAAFVPALRASGTAPVEALRNE